MEAQSLHIVYVSSATRLFTAEELVALHETCKRNNEVLGVTGLLVYNEGNFIQALEGPGETVHALMDKIRHDPRHRGVMVLMEEVKERRYFPEWAMGFCNVERLKSRQLQQVDAFAREWDRAVGLNSQAAHQLLLSFKHVASL